MEWRFWTFQNYEYESSSKIIWFELLRYHLDFKIHLKDKCYNYQSAKIMIPLKSGLMAFDLIRINSNENVIQTYSMKIKKTYVIVPQKKSHEKKIS